MSFQGNSFQFGAVAGSAGGAYVPYFGMYAITELGPWTAAKCHSENKTSNWTTASLQADPPASGRWDCCACSPTSRPVSSSSRRSGRNNASPGALRHSTPLACRIHSRLRNVCATRDLARQQALACAHSRRSIAMIEMSFKNRISNLATTACRRNAAAPACSSCCRTGCSIRLVVAQGFKIEDRQVGLFGP